MFGKDFCSCRAAWLQGLFYFKTSILVFSIYFFWDQVNFHFRSLVEVYPLPHSSQSSFLDPLNVMDFMINPLLICNELHACSGCSQYVESSCRYMGCQK